MNDPTRKVDPAAHGRPLYDEADIGSCEKSPGQHETEEMIRQIPPLPDRKEHKDTNQGRQGA